MDLEAAYIAAASSFLLAAVVCAHKKTEKKKRFRRCKTLRICDGPYHARGQYRYFLSTRESENDEFFKYTRMDRESYDILLKKIHRHVVKRYTKNSISADMKLAITLHYLSQGPSLKRLANMFEVGHSTIWKIVGDVLDVICEQLYDECLPALTTADWATIAEGFNQNWGVPNCLGSADGKYITAKTPHESGHQFSNNRKSFNVMMMALVDYKYNFRIIDVKASDAELNGAIFASTKFGEMILDETLVSSLGAPKAKSIDGTSDGFVPYFIIGGEAFPLKRHVMKPYTDTFRKGRNLSEKQEIYNNHILKGRQVAEIAFGILTTRWRIFWSEIVASPKRVEKIILTVVILHNFVMSRNVAKYLPPRYANIGVNDGSSPGKYVLQQSKLKPCIAFGSNNAKKEAYEIRKKLANYFCSAVN